MVVCLPSPCSSNPLSKQSSRQLIGRFDEEFIELRRRGLERFLNRVAKHPVLGESSVFRHFLSATDQKEWKSGKRMAEQQATSSNFLSSVEVQDSVTPMNMCVGAGLQFFPTTLQCTLTTLSCTLKLLQNYSDAIVLRFSRFTAWLDKHISAWSATFDNLAVHQQSELEGWVGGCVA